MILERFPEILALSTDEKALFAEQLLEQVMLEREKDPALIALLESRYAEYQQNPDAGVRWEDLRERLTGKVNA